MGEVQPGMVLSVAFAPLKSYNYRDTDLLPSRDKTPTYVSLHSRTIIREEGTP